MKLIPLLAYTLLGTYIPAAAEDSTGTWHAQFETPRGIQTYHFTLAVVDGNPTAVAVVESDDEKRDVTFSDVTIEAEAERTAFVEVRKLGDREVRIEFRGQLAGDGLVLSRKVGEFGTFESTATRNIPEAPASPDPASASAPMAEVKIDRVIKDAFQDAFRIGTAGDIPGRYSEQELQIAAQHFGAITPENCMKPESVHPEDGRWRFESSDALVQWAAQNSMSVHGHTLVWHAQTPDWFFQNGNREVVLQRMKDHIHTLVGRYKGRLQSWDVVNEAINDGGNEETAKTDGLRNSKWLQAIGPDYLTQAFRFAHEADPEATLYYNDYNIESGPKHGSSMVLLKRLLSEGAPVHAVGIQGHWRSGSVPFENIDKAISDYASLGLKVGITELDVTIRGASGGQFGCDCHNDHHSFHQKMMLLLADMGVTFFKNGPYPTVCETNPLSRFKPDGRLILTVPFMHPLLESPQDDFDLKRGFFSEYSNPGLDNSFCIRCNGLRSDTIPEFELNVQALADTRVSFLKAMIPVVKPKLGYVDESFGANMTEKQLDKAELRHLFWTTFFGASYVDRYGREFLLNTPAWKTEEFDDGVLITATETFLEFTRSKRKDTLVYLREKFPGIRPNRYVIPDSF